MNSLRRLATDRAINGSSSAIGVNPGGSEYSSAHARFPPAGPPLTSLAGRWSVDRELVLTAITL